MYSIIPGPKKQCRFGSYQDYYNNCIIVIIKTTSNNLEFQKVKALTLWSLND